MNYQIEPILISLFNLIYAKQYDSLMDITYDLYPQKNIDEIFEAYKRGPLVEIKMDEKKEEHLKLVLNLAIYIKDNVLPKIIETENMESMYVASKEKIRKYKLSWLVSIKTYLKNKNPKKYLIKDYNESKTELDKKTYIDSRLEIIEEWATDDDKLLSEFYYVDDLQKNQLKMIVDVETIYIVLKEYFYTGTDDKIKIKDMIDYLKNKEVANMNKQKGGQVPNIVLTDGIFRVDPISLLETNPNIIEQKDTFIIIDEVSEPTLEITVPKHMYSPELENEFHYEKDVINIGAYELATFVAILQLGRDQLTRGNRITFTFPEICELFGIEPNTYSYRRIAKAIFFLKLNNYRVRVSDTHVRVFNILSAIEYPIFNSDREKEWTVVLDDLLRKQILESHYSEIFAQTLASFDYTLSPILFKIFLVDSTAPEKEYTLAEISKRGGITGKPSQLKKRIIKSIEEILTREDSVIESYETKNDNSIFIIKYKQRNKMIS